MNISQIVDAVLIDVPGCPVVTVRDAARWAQRELCTQGNAWIIWGDVAVVDADTDDPVVDVPAYAETIAVRELYDGARRLTPMHYKVRGNRVFLRFKPKDPELTGAIVCRPVAGRDMPDEELDRWSDAVIAGAKYRLMMMPGYQWSNPQLGQYYQREFYIHIADCKRLSWDGNQHGSIKMKTPRF